MNEDQITIRKIRDRRYSIECSYEPDFIDYIKQRIAPGQRSYDPDTHIWEFEDSDGKTLNAITGVATQKFRSAICIFRDNEGKLTTRNLKTGVQTLQEELF